MSKKSDFFDTAAFPAVRETVGWTWRNSALFSLFDTGDCDLMRQINLLCAKQMVVRAYQQRRAYDAGHGCSLRQRR
jgi:hypothetical protein